MNYWGIFFCVFVIVFPLTICYFENRTEKKLLDKIKQK